MSRSSNTPNVFIVLSLILVFEASNVAKSQPFFGDVNEFMPMSDENEGTAVRNAIDTCVKPDGFCDLGSRNCCFSSACKCNAWGYNCRCQIDNGMPMSYESFKGAMHSPTEKLNKINFEKRSCIRRGGACDHRPNECCFSSSCRCNLWGSNCRCQRVGLFQKWG